MWGVSLRGTIKLNREFKFAYRRGEKYVSRSVVMHHFKNKTDENKIGITVSTALGCAVVRNRVKRYIREAFKDYKARIYTGYNIVFVARTRCAYSDFWEIKSSIDECMENSGLIK